MKTFYEYVLDEITRKLEAGDIDGVTARRWIVAIKGQLGVYAGKHPDAPIVQMPQTQ